MQKYLKIAALFYFGFAFLMLATGLSNRQATTTLLVYTGENADWAVQYTEYEQLFFYTENGMLKCDDGKSGTRLTVTYRHNLAGLATIQELDTGFEDENLGGKRSYIFEGPPSYKTFTYLGVFNNYRRGAETLIFDITVDGETQPIELHQYAGGERVE